MDPARRIGDASFCYQVGSQQYCFTSSIWIGNFDFNLQWEVIIVCLVPSRQAFLVTLPSNCTWIISG